MEKLIQMIDIRKEYKMGDETVYANDGITLDIDKGEFVATHEREKRALEALEKVGLAEKAKQMPKQLSGGQQQRVSIARALAANPSLILADEPTGALDSKTSRQVLDFFKKIHEEGNTVIMITHDNSIAIEAKRVIRIADGKINFDGSSEEYAAVI